jgi:co-chaperonin GroES (HSP10)
MIDKVYKDLVLIHINDTPSEEGEYIIPQDMEEEEVLSGRVHFKGAEATDTEIGDVVVFGKFGYSKINIEGIEYVLTKEENLICKLKANE